MIHLVILLVFVMKIHLFEIEVLTNPFLQRYKNTYFHIFINKDLNLY